MIACSINGQKRVRSPLDQTTSTVISNRCLNNNLRETIKFHFLKLLPKVRLWNFNQNTPTTFYQNSYRIVMNHSNMVVRSGIHRLWSMKPCVRSNDVQFKKWSYFGPLSRWGSVGGDFLVLVGGRFPWLWIWGVWSKSRILVIDQDYYVIPRSMIPTWFKNLGQRSNNQILSKLFTAVLCMRKWLRIHDRSRFIIRVNIFFMWCVLRIWPHSEINCHVLVSRVTILCHQWHDDPVAHSQLCHPSAYLFIFRFLKTICLHIFPNNESSFSRITK